MAGTAVNGSDYESLSGYVVIPANTVGPTNVTVRPRYRSNFGFDPIAVFTLAPTNGFVADPDNATVTIPIMDQFPTNPLPIVANPNQVVDLDYSVSEQGLVLSVNYPVGSYGQYGLPGSVGNFELLSGSGSLTSWDIGVWGLPNEVNMATVKVSTNGFYAGDAYFIGEGTGTIGWAKHDGSACNTSWVTLPDETDPEERSDVYVDKTGLWGNRLLAVTSRYSAGQSDVWGVSISNGQPVATMIASDLPTASAEGLLTLPAEPLTYGPLAGAIVVGNEMTNTLFAIAGNGAVQALNLGVSGMGVGGQMFQIVPTNQAFYCQDTLSPGPSYIRELSPAMLQGHLGDILVIQCPEIQIVDPSTGLPVTLLNPPMIWLLHWNGVSFDARCLILSDLCASDLDSNLLNFSPPFGLVEKGVFAPLDIPVPAQ